MGNYYFITTLLPPLKIGASPEINFEQLVFLLRMNLWEKDHKKCRIIRLFYDIENIRAFWKEEEFDHHGNLDEVELEEALLSRRGLPKYVYRYLDKWNSKEAWIKNFPELLRKAFQVEIRKAEGFLKEYLRFEREWRLVFAGFRAKKLGIDIAAEMQYEVSDEFEFEKEDFLVAQIMAQKDAKQYVPPEKYRDLTPIFEQYGDDPMGLHQALCEWRFNKIDEMIGWDSVSINTILGYFAQFIMVDKWIRLDKKKGNEIVERILKEKP